MLNALAGYGLKHRLQPRSAPNARRMASARGRRTSLGVGETRIHGHAKVSAGPPKSHRPFWQIRYWRAGRENHEFARFPATPERMAKAIFVGTENYLERSNIVSRFDELSTNILTVPPNHLVGPIRRVVPGDLQAELIWNFDLPGGAEPDATVACVGHEAKKHPAAVCRLQSCHAFERVARRLALVIKPFGFWHRHARTPWLTTSGTIKLGHLATGLTGAREFSAVLAKLSGSHASGRVRCQQMQITDTCTYERTHRRNELRISVMAEKDLGETVTVRFSSKTRAELKAIADADDRPVSSVVRRMVTRALNEDRQQHEGAAA